MEEGEMMVVAGDLGLDSSQVTHSLQENTFTAVVHEKWLTHALTKGCLPVQDSGIPKWNQASHGSIFTKTARPWLKATVTSIVKPSRGEFSLPQIDGGRVLEAESSFAQFMDTVAKEVYRTEWEKAYSENPSTLQRLHHTLSKQVRWTSVVDLLRHLYDCPIIDISKGCSSLASSRTAIKASNIPRSAQQHSNMVPMYCMFDTPERLYLLHPHHEHTIQDVTMFSPSMLSNSHGKVLFVVFQMLHAVLHCHKKGMSCGNISLSDFVIDEKLWVQFKGPKVNDVIAYCHSKRTCATQTCQKHLADEDIPSVSGKVEEESIRAIGTHSSSGDPSMENLPDIMQKWLMGEISNYDYLMILNRLANRQVGNPNHHPIIPWVMDFSRPDGGFRDFSKSKFRLNKGDHQLDFTYESALQMQALNEQQSSGNLAVQVPHHISDVLSEITYYIYKARCTDRRLLQSHVRSVWVPNEYPVSIQRLQAWTPDECIPEFFSDASIFRTIHEDLPNLEVPAWCKDPEDFVQKHRAVLEGPYVSEKLHHWIDLTFGYKLSGSAAIKAKNVVLCVVDEHTLPANNGVVQLFNVAHPKRFSPSQYVSAYAPSIQRTRTKVDTNLGVTTTGQGQEEGGQRSEQESSSAGIDAGEGSKQDVDLERTAGTLSQNKEGLLSPSSVDRTASTASESSPETISGRNRSQSFNNEAQNQADDGQLSKNPIRKLPFFRPKSEALQDSRQTRPELATIVLPEDYDPLSALNRLESLFSFTAKASYGLPVMHEVDEKDVAWQELVARDVAALGCTLVELCLATKMRFRQTGVDLDIRWQHLQRVMRVEHQEILRPIREILRTLFKADGQSTKDFIKLEDFVALHGGIGDKLPTLSPGILLHQHSGLVAFPKYFHSLYQFLSQLQLQRYPDPGDPGEEHLHATDLTDHQAMNMVQLARQWLPRVTPSISQEGRDLLLPHIRGLFEDTSTAVYAALSLFSKYSSHLGPKLAVEELLTPLVHLYDSDFTSPDYLLLFQHSFLSQVIVCLGLRPLLVWIVKYVTEASNGVKPCPTFQEGASEQASGLTAISSGTGSSMQDRDSFLSDNGIAIDELFCDGDGDDVEGDEDDGEYAGEEANVEDEDEEDGNENEDNTSRTSLQDDVCDDEEDSVSSSNPQDLQEPDNSVGDRISLADDSETSEPTSLEREPDTASITSANLPSLTEETEEEGTGEPDNLQSDGKASGRRTPAQGGHRHSKDQDSLFDSRIVYKKQLSSKLYQVNALIGKSLGDVASESIIWLVNRIGPSLTARYITPNLLEALSGCYAMPPQLIYCYVNQDEDGDEMDSPNVCIGKKTVAGDVNAKSVLKCLTDIAMLYGDQFIFQQYLPFIKETVRRVQKKVSSKLEGRLISSIALLRQILPYLTDSSLMEKLQYLFGKLIHPLLDIMSCAAIAFPSGSRTREVICFKLVDILNAIALRIGREMTRDHMTDILKRFFLCFKLASPNISRNNAPIFNYSRHNSLAYSTDSEDKYCVIEVDNETNQPTYGPPVHPRLQSTDSAQAQAQDLKSASLSNTTSTTSARQSSLGSLSEESSSLDDMRGVLQEVFTPELAHAAYIPLCRLTGSIHMEKIIENHEQIWALSSQHEKAMSTQETPQIQSPLSDDGIQGQVYFPSEAGAWSTSMVAADSVAGGRGTFGGNMTIVGNRIGPAFGEDDDVVPALTTGPETGERHDDTLNEPTAQTSPRGEINRSKRTLKGTWLNYWEQYLSREEQDNSFQFCHMKLQTFAGHSSGVKALCAMPNENTFLSASRDKTVKIWSLRNLGDGSTKSSCQLTYHHHRKTVFDVRLLESQRLVASCDGNVHVWDPISGAAVRGYDLSRSAPSCLEVMPAPSPCLLVSSNDSSIRFIDTRQGGVQQEISVASGPLGLIRCIAVSQDGYTLGVGLSSGVLSMVDLRTGLLLGGWRAHEGEILQIKSHSNRTFLTSSVDHNMTLWKEDGPKVCHFRGAVEPVHCVCIADDQVISATFGNRIGIHTAISAQANYSSWKLRADAFKGALSALSVLPLNKLILAASDNGSIFLLA